LHFFSNLFRCFDVIGVAGKTGVLAGIPVCRSTLPPAVIKIDVFGIARKDRP